jgi:hypothetical protein
MFGRCQIDVLFSNPFSWRALPGGMRKSKATLGSRQLDWYHQSGVAASVSRSLPICLFSVSISPPPAFSLLPVLCIESTGLVLPLDSCPQPLFLFLRQGLSCYLPLSWPETHNPPASTSWRAGIAGMHHHIWLLLNINISQNIRQDHVCDCDGSRYK